MADSDYTFIRIHREQYEKLRELAHKEDRPITSELRRAIRAWLEVK